MNKNNEILKKELNMLELIDKQNDISTEKNNELNKDSLVESNPVLELQKEEERKKLEKEELESKQRKQANKNKDILFFSFKLGKVDFSLSRSINNFEQEIFIDNALENTHDDHKIFVNYISNGLNIDFRLNDRMDTKTDIRIHNMFLFDKDFNYNKSNLQIIKESIVNQEFSCLVGSLNEENDNPMINIPSRSMSIYSEAYNLDQDNTLLHSNSKKRIVDFISIKVDFCYSEAKTNVDIVFTKLLLSFNFNFIERLALYFKQVTDLQKTLNNKENNVISKRRTMEMLKKTSLIDNLDKLDNIEDSEIIKEPKPMKQKRLFSRVADKIEKRKKDGENKQNEVVPLAKQVLEELKKVKEVKVESKTSMILSFSMKDIEVNIPLNPTQKHTKLIIMNINMLIKLNKISHIDYFYTEKSYTLLRTHYHTNDMDLNLLINNFDLDVLYFVNNTIIAHNLTNKLMLNTRITIAMKNFILHHKSSLISMIQLNIEPIYLNLGFRQIQVLNQFSSSANELSLKLKEGKLTTQHEKEAVFEYRDF